MKRGLLFIIATALCCLGHAQDKMNYPKGIYMGLEEVKSKTPSVDATLNWEKRTQGDIKMWGGNDYELKCDDKSIKKKTIKKEIFAYSDGEYLFINGFKFDLGQGYAVVESIGKFMVFKAGISNDRALQEMQMGWMFGGIVGGIQGAYLATLRFPYIVDLETGKLVCVNEEFLTSLLAGFEDLLKEFRAEDDKNCDVIIKYLNLLNAYFLHDLARIVP